MKAGITGHQERDGIDWLWVAIAIRRELMKIRGLEKSFSSLAAGTDQIFAEVSLGLRIPVTAVLPFEGYARFFAGSARENYWRLLGRCETVQLRRSGRPEHAFFEAGKFITDASNVLIAVWDGLPSKGLGGTADVVKYACRKNCRVVHINPAKKSIKLLA